MHTPIVPFTYPGNLYPGISFIVKYNSYTYEGAFQKTVDLWKGFSCGLSPYFNKDYLWRNLVTLYGKEKSRQI